MAADKLKPPVRDTGSGTIVPRQTTLALVPLQLVLVVHGGVVCPRLRESRNVSSAPETNIPVGSPAQDERGTWWSCCCCRRRRRRRSYLQLSFAYYCQLNRSGFSSNAATPGPATMEKTENPVKRLLRKLVHGPKVHAPHEVLTSMQRDDTLGVSVKNSQYTAVSMVPNQDVL